MDTVSTLSNIAHGGSGYIWYILGGLALTLTIRYSRSQSMRSGNNSKGFIAGRDINAPIDMSTNTNLPKDKSEK